MLIGGKSLFFVIGEYFVDNNSIALQERQATSSGFHKE